MYMSKSVQMSIKMEPELHDQFMAETPNSTTVAAMKAADRGEGARFESADSLFTRV
jgi:hypothetical protein